MRAPVKAAKSRRTAVPQSSPTYEVDLTHEEMREIANALRFKQRSLERSEGHQQLHDDAISALAVINWRLRGRQ